MANTEPDAPVTVNTRFREPSLDKHRFKACCEKPVFVVS